MAFSNEPYFNVPTVYLGGEDGWGRDPNAGFKPKYDSNGEAKGYENIYVNDPASGSVGYWTAQVKQPDENGMGGGIIPVWHGSSQDFSGLTGGDPVTDFYGRTSATYEDKNGFKFTYDPSSDSFQGVDPQTARDQLANNPDAYYSTLGNQLKDEIFTGWKNARDWATSETKNKLEALKSVNPKAYYEAQVGLLGNKMGWNAGQNTSDRNTEYQNAIQAMLPEMQAAGVDLNNVNSLLNKSYSTSAKEDTTRISNEASRGGAFIKPADLAFMGSIALAGLTAGASSALTGALAGTIGSSAASVVAPALLGSAASAGMAALTGGDIGKAALTGAIGGGVGGGVNSLGLDAAANLVGGGDAIMGMAKLSEAANSIGMTTSQVAGLVSGAVSTELTGLASGQSQDKLLERIANNLAATGLGNYAGNLTASISPKELMSAANVVAAITKIGVNSSLNGQDLQTSLTNNIGQIIGAAAQPTKYADITKLFNSDGSLSTSGLDEINKSTEPAKVETPTEPAKVETAAVSENTQYAPLASNVTSDQPTPLVKSDTQGVSVSQAAFTSPYLLDDKGNLMYGSDGMPIPNPLANQATTNEGITSTADRGTPLSEEQIAAGNALEEQFTSGAISKEQYDAKLAEIENPSQDPTENQGYVAPVEDFFVPIPVTSVSNPNGSVTTYYSDGSSKETVSATGASNAGDINTVGAGTGGAGTTGALDTIGASTGTSATGALDTIGTGVSPGTGTTGALDTIGTGTGTTAGTGTGTGTTAGTGTGSGGTGTGTGAGGTGTGSGSGSGSGSGTGTSAGTGGYQNWSNTYGQDQYGGITNLTPGLTKGNQDYTLAGEPMINEMANILPQFAAGGTTGITDLNDPSNKSSSGLSAALTPGLTKAQLNYILTGLPSLAPTSHAEGGAIEGHNPTFFSEGGLGSIENRYVKGEGDGTSDDVPAMLAHSEFVIPADVVSSLGNGSSDAGAKILDEFLRTIREHKRSADAKELPPDSKGALGYLLEAKKKVKA